MVGTATVARPGKREGVPSVYYPIVSAVGLRGPATPRQCVSPLRRDRFKLIPARELVLGQSERLVARIVRAPARDGVLVERIGSQPPASPLEGRMIQP